MSFVALLSVVSGCSSRSGFEITVEFDGRLERLEIIGNDAQGQEVFPLSPVDLPSDGTPTHHSGTVIIELGYENHRDQAILLLFTGFDANGSLRSTDERGPFSLVERELIEVTAQLFIEGCGDGARVAPEECDDGNILSGDGCSSACTLEAKDGGVPDSGVEDADVPDTGTVPQWWDQRWGRRRKLTFDNAEQAENLAQFPVLIHLGTSRIDYALTATRGRDLRFIDADNITELPHEVESWNRNSSSYVWVSVTQINAGNDDFIWMYYGNPNALNEERPSDVWSVYESVVHLGDDRILDARQPARTHLNQGTIDTEGFIGRGRAFDGSTWVDLSPLNLSTFEGGLALWIMTSTTFVAPTFAFFGTAAPAGGMEPEKGGFGKDDLHLGFSGSDAQIFIGGVKGADLSRTSPYADGAWHHLAATWRSASSVDLYLDGLPVGSAPYSNELFSFAGQDAIIRLGRPEDETSFYAGEMDEVRIAQNEWSADWVRAQTKSMSDDDFVHYGPEEERP